MIMKYVPNEPLLTLFVAWETPLRKINNNKKNAFNLKYLVNSCGCFSASGRFEMIGTKTRSSHSAQISQPTSS